MIIDKIENAKAYKGLGENLLKALDIIATEDFTAKEDGEYEVRGDEIYYSVSRYKTKPLDQSKFESHQKYIDVQFIAEGCEMLGYTPTTDLDSDCDYNSENDITFFPVPDNFTKVNFSKGMFAILYPEDGHMPCVENSKSENVCKVVFKVKKNA